MRSLDLLDQSTHAYKAATFRPDVPLEGHRVITTEDRPAEINVTHLSNGFTVLTESPNFPTNIHMGIHLGAGTRDETEATSGACQAISNIYLKTIKHTNETLNYLMNQMAGGHTQVKFDQE